MSGSQELARPREKSQHIHRYSIEMLAAGGPSSLAGASLLLTSSPACISR